ncbi:cation-translocating P-type ATPase [Patescibacteria group bacterium]
MDEILITSVALAVSSIPEGLLVALTVVLAIGMQRILKRKGLVRNLLSAETLGGVTTICIDKTGTLTKGEMQVVDVIGKEGDIAKQMILANDLDDPLVIAAHDWAKKIVGNPQKLVSRHKRIDSLPFSSKEKYFVSLNKDKDKTTLFLNGAPEILLDHVNLDKKEVREIKKTIDRLSKDGKRIIGLARKTLPKTADEINKRDIKELSWVGLLAFSDPIRKGVASSFEKTRKAGIKTIVITGDYPQTAINVMKQLGIKVKSDEIILGSDLVKIDTKSLSNKIDGGVKLFARIDPQQKMKIVNSLKKNGEVVAMMGDGVNDAPALKHADIGIVVGEATDVAKESADLVLMDSSFATIVASIEEGRGIFDNIRKIILYLLSDAFEEIIAVVGALILALPLPVTPAQILWINLVSDGFPDLALTVDPKTKGVMGKSPRSPKEKIVSKWMKVLIAITSLTGGLIALSFFIYFYKTTGDEVLARSITFASLGVNSLVFVFSVRTLTEPFWKSNPLVNKWLNLAVFAGLIFQFIPFATPGLRSFFEIKNPGVYPIILVFGGSLITFIIIEVGKGVIRSKAKWFSH